MVTRPKFFTLDGRRYRISPLVPTQAIRRLVSRLHVSQSDEDVRDEIETRARENHWPTSLVEPAVRYALSVHRKNQKLYSQVSRGQIG